ncbi:MAG TPA: vWA domain-containing protein, partial [Phycisphaerae bacterium]|nr:vWA domain-containing protein [Phycisphaerae bacterium]
IGADGAPAGEGKNWLARGGGDSGGPRSSFMGTGGRAYHIIWVVDRSGSMHDTFDIVAKEMTISIGRLQAVQDFHVIFFSTGQPVENPPKRLVPATAANKLDAGEFLGGVIPQGKTDPIPALQRAFEVLKRADPARPGKLIYLLTDGDFPNSAEVLRSIRERNAKKEIHINTYLYQYRGEHAVSVMRQIADQNNGKYKYVSADE